VKYTPARVLETHFLPRNDLERALFAVGGMATYVGGMPGRVGGMATYVRGMPRLVGGVADIHRSSAEARRRLGKVCKCNAEARRRNGRAGWRGEQVRRGIPPAQRHPSQRRRTLADARKECILVLSASDLRRVLNIKLAATNRKRHFRSLKL
jgi:hypothetical protein